MALIRTGAKAISDARCVLGFTRPGTTAVFYKDADGTTGAGSSDVTLADFSVTNLISADRTVTKTGNHKVFLLQTSSYATSPVVTVTEVTGTTTITGEGAVIYSI